MMSAANANGHPISARLRDFAVAGAFLTRLPLRPSGVVGPGDLARAAWAFPLIGLIVGAAAGGALWAAAQWNLHPLLCALLGLAAAALLTGALHEDGLADFADGLGAGGDRARRLEIMRDSRIGTYGVLALVFSVGLRAGALAGIGGPGLALAAMLAAAMVSRGLLPMIMALTPPARADGLGHSAGRPGLVNALIALALAIVGATLFLEPDIAVTAVIAAVIAAAVVAILARRGIGGHTGDVLGAAQQVSEIAVLTAAGVVFL